MEIYAVGDVTTVRENDIYMADAKVVRLFQNDDGERMVEYEIIKLASGYAGPLTIGAKHTVPEEGVVGTFTNPS